MTTFPASTLGDVAEHASLLAGIFQLKGNTLRAAHIRKADKALLGLEAIFDAGLSAACTTWRRGREAQRVLEERLVVIGCHQARMADYETRLGSLEKDIEKWMSLSENDRARVGLNARKAQQYFEARTFNAESHILHRYERYQALRGLVAYADNAHFLCEAIHHFENREKYEDNKAKLEKRRDSARERLRGVTRGFWFATAFCFLIVTIPLCAPFAWSLYRRKREVENQIANLEETIRREDKRLQAADEGVVAAQEIREILGPLPLEQVRSTLGEVSELRREFQAASGGSVTASLIAFTELFGDRLETLFGEMPRSSVDRFRWLAAKVDEVTNAELEKARLGQDLAEVRARLKKLLRGHSVGMVRSSLENVRKATREALPLDLDEWVKREFADLGSRFPGLLQDARQALWHISHGQSIDEGVWKRLGVRLAGESNLLNACALELRLGASRPQSEAHETDAGTEALRALP
ncbi:MAG: hypothetical protein IOD12_14785 [Silvanigrellales bacterium]|nr:hypothetical protein [Silvanigrellales bacterium]